jgi:hypothetical protein
VREVNDRVNHCYRESEIRRPSPSDIVFVFGLVTFLLVPICLPDEIDDLLVVGHLVLGVGQFEAVLVKSDDTTSMS